MLDLALEAPSKLDRKFHDDLQWTVIESYALDQPRLVAGQDCRSADLLAEGFAFPLKICLGAIDRFIRESEGIVHTPGSGSEEGGDGLDADAGRGSLWNRAAADERAR